MKFDIVSIGSAMKDIFLLSDRGKIFHTPKDKLAQEWLGFELGEKICVDEEYECLGGVASSLSVGTRKLGLKSTLVSSIPGNYEWVAGELKKNGVDVSFISPVIPQKLSLSIIVVDKKTGERVIFYNHDSGHIGLNFKKLPLSRYYTVSSLTGPWTKKILGIIPHIEKQKGKIILLPSTNQIRNNFSDFKKLLKGSEIIILNRNEAVEIAVNAKSKKFDIAGLIELIRNLGPKIIVVTDGLNGAWASDDSQFLFAPVIKVKSVDTTGAGDAFAGGFLGYFIKGHRLEECLKAGIINGASVVRYPGITKGLLKKNEIVKQLKSVKVKRLQN
ncbi:MAG: carbohydrate kinase family protein [Parcubacteria group bacterium]|jgi:sugar/nucleoside kinase (ribokinase family)